MRCDRIVGKATVCDCPKSHINFAQPYSKGELKVCFLGGLCLYNFRNTTALRFVSDLLVASLTNAARASHHSDSDSRKSDGANYPKVSDSEKADCPII
jgi:hypothetical protein